MIRKVQILAILLLCILLPLSAVTEYTQSIPVSFTFDIIANYGFSSRKVSGFMKPESIAGDSIGFHLDRRTSELRSSDFYVYYQIFTTDNVKIVLDVGNLKKDGGSETLSFSSSDTYSFSTDDSSRIVSGKEYTLVDKKSDTPYYDSFLLAFIIDDITEVDWSATYTAPLTLKMVVTE